jgi:hypothetical protein
MIVINNFTPGGGSSPAEDIIPVGAIVLYYGTSTTIPAGYAICDGTSGTPNLKGKFIMGASSSGELLTTGGAETHIHSQAQSSSEGGHNHAYDPFNFSTPTTGNYIASGGSTLSHYSHYHTSSGGNTATDGSHSHSPNGSSGAGSSLPVHKLYYWVQRIS